MKMNPWECPCREFPGSHFGPLTGEIVGYMIRQIRAILYCWSKYSCICHVKKYMNILSIDLILYFIEKPFAIRAICT